MLCAYLADETGSHAESAAGAVGARVLLYRHLVDCGWTPSPTARTLLHVDDLLFAAAAERLKD